MIVRVADGSSERLRMFAQELASERLDVLVAVAPSGIAAAREASRTTPIVGVDLETDPVAAGWIASLSRPGGNVTGVFLDMPEFAAKCLQMLMEVVGRRVSIGVLWDPSTGGYQRASVEPAAASMGLELKLRETAALSDVGPAVYSLAAEGVGGLLILSSPLFSANTTAVAALTTASRLPAIMLFPEFARDGGLIGYGPDLQDLFRRAGIMARRVIDGTPPAEVPVERPVRFSLIVNVRAARTVGVDVPPTLLARADEVIE
jgi:putative tryptophan/tyrosine transport system substrate-binding protein